VAVLLLPWLLPLAVAFARGLEAGVGRASGRRGIGGKEGRSPTRPSRAGGPRRSKSRCPAGPAPAARTRRL